MKKITADKLQKRKERWEHWKKHCEEISKKVKLNEFRTKQSEEYAKHFYSD